MHSGLCCGLFRGEFYIKDLSNQNSGLVSLGNAEATITQEMTTISQPNFTSLGGSNCQVDYVDSVSLDLTLHCVNPENLAIGFMGSSYQKTGATVASESHTVFVKDSLIAFENVPDKTLPITVESGADTFVEGTDYVVTNAGIKIPETSTIDEGTVLEISYTYGDNWKLDAQTVSQKEYMVVLDGVNVGEGGETAVVLKAWKVKFAPTDSFALISGTDFASLAVSGEILRDQSKVQGSKFMTVEWGKVASGAY